MGPYLAVIYDSFLEAFKSRILWVLLIGWTLLLAALAPFGWIEGNDYQFRNDNITNRDKLLEDLYQASSGNGTEAQRKVWKGINEQFRTQVLRAKNEGRSLRPGTIAEGLSSALDNEDLYDAEAWPKASKWSELSKDLENYKPGDLQGEDLARVNQRLIELAFPTSLKNSAANSIWIGYGGIKLFNPIPVSRDQLRPFIDGFILIAFLKIALGIVGIFIAVIVTSNLVPDMFAPGSMALLLSKPIQRSGLLLAKYVGGLCFIFINVAYLLVGFYFVLGLRMDIWNRGLLLCIPLFLFVFMIFYSVSTLAGLIWKNAIVSIVCVGLFWGGCFIIGLTYEPLKQFTVELPQITKLTVIGEEFVGTNRDGELLIWNQGTNEWASVGGGGGNPERRIIGPLWLPERQSLIYGRAIWNRFLGMQNDGVPLQLLDMRKTDSNADEGTEEFLKAPLWSEKRIENIAQLPSGTRRFKVIGTELIAITDTGIFRYDLDAAKAPREEINILGIFKLPKPSAVNVSTRLTAEEMLFQTPIDFCAIPGSNDLLVVSQSKLQRFRLEKDGDKESLQVVSNLDLDIPSDALALVSSSAKTALVFTNQDKAFAVDLEQWSLREMKDPALMTLDVKEMYPKGDAGFVLLTKKGDIHYVTPDGLGLQKVGVDQRVTSIALDQENRLYYCTIGNVLSRLEDQATGKSQTIAKPSWTTAQWIYWTLVRPIYIINPKPSAVDRLMQWALQSEQPSGIFGQTEEMEEASEDLDLWTPVWSNSLFIVAMLTVSCLYLRRQDN